MEPNFRRPDKQYYRQVDSGTANSAVLPRLVKPLKALERALTLSDNKITKITPRLFQNLSLEYLDISRNELIEVPIGKRF